MGRSSLYSWKGPGTTTCFSEVKIDIWMRSRNSLVFYRKIKSENQVLLFQSNLKPSLPPYTDRFGRQIFFLLKRHMDNATLR